MRRNDDLVVDVSADGFEKVMVVLNIVVYFDGDPWQFEGSLSGRVTANQVGKSERLWLELRCNGWKLPNLDRMTVTQRSGILTWAEVAADYIPWMCSIID